MDEVNIQQALPPGTVLDSGKYKYTIVKIQANQQVTSKLKEPVRDILHRSNMPSSPSSLPNMIFMP